MGCQNSYWRDPRCIRLNASLDRFPRFACGLDRPKPLLSLGFSHNDVGCVWDGYH